MKHVLLILDGASDEQIPELNGQTPLEAACTPHLDYLARSGTRGRLQTAFQGLPVDSLVCIMGILGYDPARYYPGGRASVEALARGISLAQDDLALRCNIVRVSDNGETLLDFTAGMISDRHAERLLTRASLPDRAWELHTGQSYRNLLVIRGIRRAIPDIVETLECCPPHMHSDEKVHGLLPEGKTRSAEKPARQLRDFMLDSYIRFTAGKRPKGCAGNMLWVWSPSAMPDMPAFQATCGKRGCVAAGLDFMHGLGMSIGMDFKPAPAATGYTDTDYSAKAGAAIGALDEYDFALVHVNSPDEASHQRNPREKVLAIERVDRFVVGPLLCRLRDTARDDFTFAVCADHMTRCRDGKHAGVPTPYLVYPGARPAVNGRLTERSVEALPVLPSLDIIREIVRT
ncbi:MAG: 2,3-bisphosphoglycerate-independent phosphoglycerate mutase [Deltaproteobacteria bacterium]|jgi:2,3-bisphosphoglycerate-independent phosphoglycerate mutase|nr:2,3-bisphosphoglycerate-independent phosphoglycerate mutase [Deltaproteobacteria bacterium]